MLATSAFKVCTCMVCTTATVVRGAICMATLQASRRLHSGLVLLYSDACRLSHSKLASRSQSVTTDASPAAP